MADTLIGRDFTPPDVRAKVTGRAKYPEDFRADGMLFCRLLTSPMPHARVRSIDASDALAIDGVVAILTADEVPAMEGVEDPILNNEPRYVGEPILAVAAESETLAHDAIERIRLDLEPLPFTVDPLESLREGGPNARVGGNTPTDVQAEEGERTEGAGTRETKWSEEVFREAGEGRLPMGEAPEEWTYGDLDAAFAEADLVLDETFVTAGTCHHCMETRTAMAYWQNGKCYVYGSGQSQSRMLTGLVPYLGVEPEQIAYIGEYCGGGFGSKGRTYPTMAIPAHMSRKTGRPVLMRISRQEENFIGSGRPGFQGRIRMGFRDDGRLLAADLFIVQDNGPNVGGGDLRSAAEAVSLVYTPGAMRYRGLPVLTNTTPRGAQRGPGQNQIACAVEPLLDKAAKELGVDRVEIRKINSPDSETRYGAEQEPLTSSFHADALDIGAEAFDWETKSARSGQRNGSKVRGVGVGQAFHSAGSDGYDGMLRITPDGILHIHSGVGNLGTYSYAASCRIAPQVLNYDWDRCEIIRGDSEKGLAWSSGQGGSNTSFTMTRAHYVAALDMAAKLKELAALELGGSADDYELGDEIVFARANPSRRLTYGDAARSAMQRGGKFTGEVYPDDLNDETKRALETIVGTGLIGVARDGMGREGTAPATAVGFVEIELDLDTGLFEILDYVGVPECGKVIHPMGLAAQVKGGAVQGFGMASLEHMVYERRYGLSARTGLYQTRPPTYLDVPSVMRWAAVDRADPQNPAGARGVGEPLLGCAASALLCAISDALGGHYFNRSPVTTDMIVNAASGRPQSFGPLDINTE